MVFSDVLNQLIILFALMVIGYVIRKVNIINDESTKGLSEILTKVALPSTIVVSMQKPYSTELFIEILQIMFIFFCVQLFSISVSFLLSKIMKIPFGERGVYALTLGFCNVSFMGYPVLLTIFGEDSLFYASYCNIIHTATLFSLGIALCMRYSGKPKQPLRKNLKLIFLNNAFIAGIIGFVLFVLSISLPKQIFGVLQLTGDLTTPISMLVIGSLLTKNRFTELLCDWKQYVMAAFRLLVISLLVFYFFRWTNWIENIYLLKVLCVIIAMPCAATMSILAVQYGNEENAHVASRITFITTFFSIITIPLITLLIVN